MKRKWFNDMKVPLQSSGFALWHPENRDVCYSTSECWLIKSVMKLVNISPISPQIHYTLQQIHVTAKLVSSTVRVRGVFVLRVLNPNRDGSQGRGRN